MKMSLLITAAMLAHTVLTSVPTRDYRPRPTSANQSDSDKRNKERAKKAMARRSRTTNRMRNR